jgi:hypothetical protein
VGWPQTELSITTITKDSRQQTTPKPAPSPDLSQPRRLHDRSLVSASSLEFVFVSSNRHHHLATTTTTPTPKPPFRPLVCPSFPPSPPPPTLHLRATIGYLLCQSLTCISVAYHISSISYRTCLEKVQTRLSNYYLRVLPSSNHEQHHELR